MVTPKRPCRPRSLRSPLSQWRSLLGNWKSDERKNRKGRREEGKRGRAARSLIP